VGGQKGGYFVTEKDESVMASGRDTISRRDLEAMDEITILDYVLIDFADGSFAPRKNAQREVETEPWSHDY
jgi:hypothetical protein